MLTQAERIAAMLNYFLLQLVGPQRKALRLSDPEKYEFRPKELLVQVWWEESGGWFWRLGAYLVKIVLKSISEVQFCVMQSDGGP
jgi:hypothetical protein